MNSSEHPSRSELDDALRELRVVALISLARRQGIDHASLEEARALATTIESNDALYQQIAYRAGSNTPTALGDVIRRLREWLRNS